MKTKTPLQYPGYWKIRKVIKKLDTHFLNYNINFDEDEHILVFSSPRGGSTWLAEVLSSTLNIPVLWEPMLKRTSSRFYKLNFAEMQYLPKEDQNEEVLKQFERLFKGKGIDAWEKQKTDSKSLIQSNKVLIKFCRGNMLLPYITNQFNFKKKPVFLIRHPFAVVASQMKHIGWKDVKSTFEIPKNQHNEVYSKHQDYLKTLKSIELILIAQWCITNKVPLDDSQNNKDWITITYEEMILNPQLTVKRIFDEWGIETNVNSINFRKKSSTTRQGSPILPKDQLGYWKTSFNDKQINQMIEVLNYFSIELYDNDVMPKVLFNKSSR